MNLIKKRIDELKEKGIERLDEQERIEFLEKIELFTEHEINNPKINSDDKFYHEELILLVQEKNNWHLYCNKEKTYVYSIAVVSGAKSSSFGDISYFKRWFNHMNKNSKIEEFLTSEAKNILKEVAQ